MTKFELVQAIDCFWILPIVLDQIDVVGSSQETGEGRGLRVPQRRRDDACT